jgi:hypothetical protein
MYPVCHVVPAVFTLNMDLKQECDGEPSDVEGKPLFDTLTNHLNNTDPRFHVTQENADVSSCSFEVSFWKLNSFTITLD